LIFQQSSLYPYLSALDNVAFGFMLQGVGRDDAVYLADRVIILIARPG
jgi:ABC-type nitrate/sulfonate/bicarbonate transport system ATPase subunit